MFIYSIKKARINKVKDYELFLTKTINQKIEEKSKEALGLSYFYTIFYF